MRALCRFLFALLFLTACGGPPVATLPPPRDDPGPRAPRRALPLDEIRVGLRVEVERVRVEALVDAEILEPGGRRLARVDAGPLSLARRGSGLGVWRNETLLAESPASQILLRARGDGERWRSGDNVYGGQLRLRRAARGVTLVEQVGVEEYLRGVVPWEIGRPEPAALEAVKAQAIAARTYTLAHRGHWEDLGFDVYDTVADQVYRGLTGIHPITDRAVRETRGRVLLHEGRLIRAYYSSTCGGHTSTLEDVWTREGAPYLVGRRDAAPGGSSWCAGSPHFRWAESWSARELGEIVRRHLPRELGRSLDPKDIGVLEGLEVLERDRSGRVQRLAIRTDRELFELWGDRIRWVLRPARGRFGILRSTLFEVENVRREGRLVGVRMRGGGFGHGVGLCQTGALGMARAGYDAEQILRHYYAGVDVADARRGIQLP